MMKKLIISEGKYDIIFLRKTLLDKLKFPEDKIKFYNQEENIPFGRKKTIESDYVNSFIQETSPYNILAKSEGNKPNALRVLYNFIGCMIEKDVQVCLLIDLDDKKIESFMSDDIQGVLSTRNLDIQYSKFLDNEYFITLKVSTKPKYSLQGVRDLTGIFYVMIFNKSLEDVAGIYDTDKEDDKIKKIEKLLEEHGYIINHFHKVFNN